MPHHHLSSHHINNITTYLSTTDNSTFSKPISCRIPYPKRRNSSPRQRRTSHEELQTGKQLFSHIYLYSKLPSFSSLVSTPRSLKNPHFLPLYYTDFKHSKKQNKNKERTKIKCDHIHILNCFTGFLIDIFNCFKALFSTYIKFKKILI